MEGSDDLIFDKVIVSGRSRSEVEAIACVYFFEGKIVHQESKVMIGKNCTTYRAHLKAVIEALDKSQKQEKVFILTDCKYCVITYNMWMGDWNQNNWENAKECKYIGEIQKMSMLKKEYIHVELVEKMYVKRARTLRREQLKQYDKKVKEEIPNEENLESSIENEEIYMKTNEIKEKEENSENESQEYSLWIQIEKEYADEMRRKKKERKEE